MPPHPPARRARGEPAMKFGLFYELQLPKPYDQDQWDPDAERRIYHEMLDQVELADSLGFDYVFEVEHHFLEEYSHSSTPELMMAAAQPAHEEHPPRPRHRADAARLQPPRARRRAHRRARPPQQRPRRVRHRRVGVGDGARRLRRRPRPEEGDVGRSDARDHQHDDAGRPTRASRANSSPCPRATSFPSRCRSRTRRCGSPPRGARPRWSPHAWAWRRSASASRRRRSWASARRSTTG